MDYSFSDKLANLRPSAIREIFKSLTDPSIISFAAGNPSPESFPTEALADIAADIFKTQPAAALQYSITEGYPPLREAIASRQKAKFGIGRDFDTTIVVSGGQQGIELACKAFCNEGDVVLCEEPSFIGALNAFRSFNVTLKSSPVEPDGMDMDKLEDILKNDNKVKLVYVIPTFQNPSGRVMSLEKRKQLLALADRYNFMILEDNPYYDLRYEGEVVPTIKSLDENGRVIYCGSFSKVLAPGIRVGYVTAPDWMISKLTVAKQLSDVHTNLLMQMVIYHYLEEVGLDQQIEKIIKINRKKRDLMLEGLEASCGDFMHIEKPEGGLFLWATLPEGFDGMRLCKIAGQYKIAAVPGSSFCVNDYDIYPAIRLNFSLPTHEQIEQGCAYFGKACEAYQKEMR